MPIKVATIIDTKFQDTLLKLSVNDVPIETAVKLRNTIKTIQDEYKKYHKNKDNAFNNKKDMLSFVKEMSTIVNTEIDIEKISLDDLGDNHGLTSEELLYITDLIK